MKSFDVAFHCTRDVFLPNNNTQAVKGHDNLRYKHGCMWMSAMLAVEDFYALYEYVTYLVTDFYSVIYLIFHISLWAYDIICRIACYIVDGRRNYLSIFV